MGTKDKSTRRLEEYNDVFADIINVLVFQGERIVQEADLTDMDTKSEIVADDKGLRSQDRDIVKFWTKEQVRIALFGLENQAAPDFQMPLRFYSYNGASYKAQMIPDRPNGRSLPEEPCSQSSLSGAAAVADHPKESPKIRQSFYPVLTLVLYFGLEHWNTAKTLYEAVNIPDALKPFIPDMPINLIEVAWLEDEVIERFESDFKVVARFFKQLRLRGDSFPDMQDPIMQKRITHVLDLMRLMSAYSGDPRFEASAQNLPQTKETTMLKMLNRLEERGRNQGRAEGVSDLNKLYANLLMQGRNDDLVRAIQDPAFLKKLMAEFGMEEEDVLPN